MGGAASTAPPAPQRESQQSRQPTTDYRLRMRAQHQFAVQSGARASVAGVGTESHRRRCNTTPRHHLAQENSWRHLFANMSNWPLGNSIANTANIARQSVAGTPAGTSPACTRSPPRSQSRQRLRFPVPQHHSPGYRRIRFEAPVPDLSGCAATPLQRQHRHPPSSDLRR
jgi:hypothetical protein